MYNRASRLQEDDTLMIRSILVICLVAALMPGVRAEVEPNAEAVEAYNAFVEAHQAQDAAKAEAALKKAKAAQADWSKPCLELGKLYIDQKQYAAATKELTEAVRLDPGNAEGHLFLGQSLVSQEVYSKAYPELEKALELDPSLHEAHKLLGSAYDEDGDYAKAQACYTAYTAAVPGDANAFMLLAQVNKKLGKRSAAVAAYKSAIKADPKLATAHFNLGNLYLEGEDFSDAEACFAQTAKLEPNNVSAYYNLAIALHSQGELEKALAQYEKVIQVGSGQKGAAGAVKQAREVIPALKEQIAAGN